MNTNKVLESRIVRNFGEVKLRLSVPGEFRFWRSLWLLALVIMDGCKLLGVAETFKLIASGYSKKN